MNNTSMSTQQQPMEATIKYENCEDVYGDNQDETTPTMNSVPSNHYYGDQLHSHQQPAAHHNQQQPHQQSHHQHHNNLAVKRNFEQMQNGGAGAVTAAAVAAAAMNPAGNYNTSSSAGNSNSHMNADHHNSYFPPHGFGGMPPHHAPEYDMFHHLNARMDIYNTAPQSDGKPLKKYKRGESSLLFNPPFFKLIDGFASPNHKDAIAARCYACGKVVRGNKSISSNFIKHMKRGHPEINKIYDSYKIYRIKTGVLPHLSQIMDGKMDLKFEKDDSCGVIGDSNDETGPYIDASAILDSSEIGEDDKHSENSENDDDSINMVNNPQSRDTSDGNPENMEFRKQILTASLKDKAEPSSKVLLDDIAKMMDDKLKEFVKQADIQKLTKTVHELNSNKRSDSLQQMSASSGDDSALIVLKKEMEHLKQECSALRLAVQQSQASKRQLQNELQSVDRMLHQRKLIIRNLKVMDPSDPQKSVQKLFIGKLGLETINILNCCIIPSAKAATDSDRKCVVVELQNHQDAKVILRQIPKLKDTGIFIESEISPLQRKRKDKLMIVRKELLRRKPDLKVMVRNTTLVVNGQHFYWDSVEGLCHDANKEALELNAIEYLKVLTTLDLKEFIEILQNYDVQVR